MNWKRYVFLGLISMLMLLDVNGQMVSVKERKSGYLNKFNVISIKPVLGFSRQPQKGGAQNEKGLSINRGLNIAYERMLTNKNSIILETEFSKTSSDILTDLEEEFDSYFNEFNYIGKDELEYRIIGIKGSPTIRERSVGVKYKQYLGKNSALAPFGSYFQVGVAMNQIEVDLSPTLFKIRTERNWGDDPIFFENSLVPISSKSVARASLGFGSSSMILKNILVSGGIDFGYLFLNIEDYGEYSRLLSQRIEYIIAKRMKRKYYSSFNCGVAYVF